MKHLKLFFLLLFCFFDVSADQPDDTIFWYDLETAITKSNEKPKPIFIEFTAKWCGWCKKMEKTTFQNEAVIDFLNKEHYAVKIDFDSPTLVSFGGNQYTGKELAKYFGIEGLPTMIYLSSTNSEVEKIIGYKTSKQLIRELNKLSE